MTRNAAVYGTMLLAVSFVLTSSAQVTLTGTNYTQSFDSIGSGLPAGWSVRTNATAILLGTEVAFTTNNTSWGNTSGQFANYAATSNNGSNFLGGESAAIQNACTNRCPGVRLTTSFGDPGAAFVFELQDTLGFANFQLSVDLNMLSVQARSNAWIVDYGIGTIPVSFTPVWTNADPGAFGTTTRTVSLGAALDNQQQPVWLRVVTLDAAAGSGSRDTFGIDNFKLNFERLAGVSPVPLQLQLIGTNAVLTWTNSSFGLQAAARLTGVFTNVPGATSPYTNPIADPERYFRLKAN